MMSIRFTPVGGMGLESGKQREFESFVKYHAQDIVKKWVDFFVYKKSLVLKVITKRI